jgi:hypothetical protein
MSGILDVLGGWLLTVAIAVFAGIVIGCLLGIASNVRDIHKSIDRIEQRSCTHGESSTMVTIDKLGTVRQAAPAVTGCRP